jgi:hypothetical protein
MISDQEFLYGAAFLKFINFGYKVTINHDHHIYSSLYLNTKALDQLLSQDQGDDKYQEVEINFLIKVLQQMPSHSCEGYSWEDKRVEEVLRVMRVEGINRGILSSMFVGVKTVKDSIYRINDKDPG